MSNPNLEYCPSMTAIVDRGAVAIDDLEHSLSAIGDLERSLSADESQQSDHPNLDLSFTSRCILREVFHLRPDVRIVTISVVEPNRKAPVRRNIAVANPQEQRQLHDFLKCRIGERMDSVLNDLRRWREAL